jgi:hypothetical protein
LSHCDTDVTKPWMTRRSDFFDALFLEYPFWSRFCVSQELLRLGYRIDFFPGQREKAWLGLRLKQF